MDNNERGSRKFKILFGILIVLVIILALALILVLKDKNGTKQIANNGVNYEVPAGAKDAKEAIAKTNPIVGNEVMTASGTPAKNDVLPMSPNGPRPTDPINLDLPDGVIRLSIDANGFSPNQFAVEADKPTTLALTSLDEAATHILAFDNPSLSAVYLGVVAKETRAITFKTPAAPGKYPFHCDVPGHAATENGLMIVK